MSHCMVMCISTCPGNAIKLIHKEMVATTPLSEDAWFEEWGKNWRQIFQHIQPGRELKKGQERNL